MEEQLPDDLETIFNNGVREITILCLTGLMLCISAHLVLSRLYKVDYASEEDAPSAEDEMVFKISYAICCFSLAVSAGSTLLLPISSISNEVLHRYPNSWYIKWLNASLIQGIWNLIFMLSNMSLFVCLPFAYLFVESEGLFGYKRGLLSRAKETLLTLLLLSLVIIGLVYIITALVDWDQDSLDRLINLYSYLPMLYSWVSAFGVSILLICTPIGFSRMFDVVGNKVVKPTTARNLEEECLVAEYEEEYLRGRMDNFNGVNGGYLPKMGTVDEPHEKGEMMLRCRKELEETTDRKETLIQIKRTSVWRRAIGYPLIMIVLFLFTIVSLAIVIINVMEIVAGFKSLPAYSEDTPHTLGIASLTSLGATGVLIEVVLIIYLFVTSMVGLYRIPYIRNIRPQSESTTLTQIILNCAIWVILSTALPLQVKILGITNFDLLGSFGKISWLGNFYLVLLYNALFVGFTSFCLFTKFTARVRHEILNRIVAFVTSKFSRNVSSKLSTS